MTASKLRNLVDRYSGATDNRTANLILCEVTKECEALCEKDDQSAYSLLVLRILVEGGHRRKRQHILDLFPVLYALVGDRQGTRLADFSDDLFGLLAEKT